MRVRRFRVTGRFDIAVVGGGFAGSLFALAAKRSGRSVVLIEKERHPRFAIGESTSPLANLFLEELCDTYGLDRVRPLAAFGTWQRERFELDCGLKRGFSFFAHREGEPWVPRPGRENELLVAASPNDDVADTHWLRADVDAFLFSEARRSGVECLEETSVVSLAGCAGDWSLSLRSPAGARVLRAPFLVDASGPRGFLHKALALEETGLESLPAIEGLYTHFENVGRAGLLAGHAAAGSSDAPPYPADDAAVHHVFEGGWVWVLRFGSGLVSAGVAATPALARSLRLEEGGAAWSRLLDRHPFLRAQFQAAEPDREFRYAPRLPFRAVSASGAGWTMLPSAAAFADPLLSTGFPLALAGVRRLAGIVHREWDRPDFQEQVDAAGELALREADAAALLVAALYASLGDFALFSRLTLLYFAAASYAEAATRLRSDAAAPARGFLLLDHPRFASSLRRICRDVVEAGRRGALPVRRRAIMASVLEAIEPVDVVGLSDPARRGWYPFEIEPLLASAGKLGAAREDVAEMVEKTSRPTGPDLAKSGWSR
jgi:FADH2 O2-dependent halogenase